MNAKKAAYVAGFRSHLMLDYLERQGLFVRQEIRNAKPDAARPRGRRRVYSFHDLVVLRSIAKLLEQGVSVERIRRAVVSLVEDDKFQCERQSVRYGHEAIQYLVTDGTEIYFKRDHQAITSILQGGQQSFLFILDVVSARDFVAKRDPLPKRKRGTSPR